MTGNMLHGKKKTDDKPKTDWSSWLLLVTILILGLTSLYSGLTGQGHYDKKRMHFYSAQEEMGIGTVCLLGCVYIFCVMRRRPKKNDTMDTPAVVPNTQPRA